MYKCGLKNHVKVLNWNFTQTLPNKTYMVVRGKTPTHTGFPLQMSQPLHAKNWIEVALHFEVVDTNKSKSQKKGFHQHIQQVKRKYCV